MNSESNIKKELVAQRRAVLISKIVMSIVAIAAIIELTHYYLIASKW